MFKVETLSSSDLQKLIELEKLSFPDPWGEEVIRKKFKKNSKCFRVIKDRNNMLGFYCAEERETTNTKLEPEVAALVSSIAVSQDQRDKGLGLLLLQDAIKYLRKISKKRIVLHTRIDNEAMIRTSQKAGFRMVGIVPDFYYDHTRDAYEFEFSR